MLERYHIDLSNMSDGDVILMLKEFAARCGRHPAFRAAPPECVPGPAHYTDLADNMTQIVMATPQNKDSEQQKRAIRERGERAMTYTTQYIIMFADHHNDPSMLNDLGVELVRKSPYNRKGRQTPPPPSRFIVKDAPEPGAISVSVSNRPGKGSVEVQVNEVSPTSEELWRRLGNYYECRFTAKGLDSVRKYYVRVRFDTSAGPGPWSETLSVVVS